MTDMTHRRRAMPEWLDRLDRPTAPWTVLPGSMQRGEAFTDLLGHRMQVPLGNDETSRCIRAHEMMHAKVSPTQIWIPDEFDHLQHPSVIAAEEFRINMLTKAAGFPVDRSLSDGSEKRTGERLGANGDWNGAVLMLAAVVGTKSARLLTSGIRSTRPEWIPALREITTQLQRQWRNSTRNGISAVASSAPWMEATHGWRFTLRVASIVQRSLINDGDSDAMTGDDLRLLAQGRLRRFAPLIQDHLPQPLRIAGYLGQRSTPRSTGRHPRYINRLLTDPEQRVFAGRRQSAGGTVLIDQSGSMHLSDADLWKIVAAAPGCTVIGYSHLAGSRDQPNIWILAQRGRAVSNIPLGNGGNGVDGPALHFALQRHRRGEPFIWVCDGYVTDEHDNFSNNLAEQCAQTVIQNRIHHVADLDHAFQALDQAGRGRRLPTQVVGPLRTTPSATAHFGTHMSLISA